MSTTNRTRLAALRGQLDMALSRAKSPLWDGGGEACWAAQEALSYEIYELQKEIELLGELEFTSVVWLSRHAMTPDQQADLAKTLGVDPEDLSVTTENVCWHASADEAADKAANEEIWLDFLLPDASGHTDYDAIAGVFPPVAREAFPEGFRDFTVLEAVSVPNPEARKTEGLLPFTHARWARMRV